MALNLLFHAVDGVSAFRDLPLNCFDNAVVELCAAGTLCEGCQYVFSHPVLRNWPCDRLSPCPSFVLLEVVEVVTSVPEVSDLRESYSEASVSIQCGSLWC